MKNWFYPENGYTLENPFNKTQLIIKNEKMVLS